MSRGPGRVQRRVLELLEAQAAQDRAGGGWPQLVTVDLLAVCVGPEVVVPPTQHIPDLSVGPEAHWHALQHFAEPEAGAWRPVLRRRHDIAPPTRSALESTRRACTRLADDHRIDYWTTVPLHRVPIRAVAHWETHHGTRQPAAYRATDGTRYVAAVRLPLTDAEAHAEDEHRARARADTRGALTALLGSPTTDPGAHRQ